MGRGWAAGERRIAGRGLGWNGKGQFVSQRRGRRRGGAKTGEAGRRFMGKRLADGILCGREEKSEDLKKIRPLRESGDGGHWF
jgi:hypothetical protein